MKNLITFVICFAICLSTLMAQSIDTQKLDAYFDLLEQNEKLSGTVAISEKGKVIYTRGFGYADKQSERKPDENTKFRIGSISKMFTSVLVFQAIEENKLSLNTKLDQFFPEVPNASSISIDDLLSHRSGIFNLTNSPEYLTYHTQAKTREELLKTIADYESIFEPGTKADYSNSNYLLLSWILEDVFEKPYTELVDIYIAKPLGLKNTKVGTKILGDQNEAFSYNLIGNWELSQETDMSIPLGAGAIVSTPTDLLKFLQSLFEQQLISGESLETMTDIRDGFGRGALVIPFKDKKSFGHTGGIDEFRSMASYFLEEDFGFAMIANAQDYNPNDVALFVLNSYFGNDPELPSFEEVSVSEEELDQFIGEYGAEGFPLTISVKREGKRLIGQATGQGAFPIRYDGENTFSFAQAGLVMEFFPEDDLMVMKQSGMEFKLTRNK